MGTIDPRDAIPLTDEGKRLQDEYRQRMKEALAEIPTFDVEQMRKDTIRIHSDAIHQMGGDPVQRRYVDALTKRLAAAEQRATDAEATLATIGGADKATLARKLRRANAEIERLRGDLTRIVDQWEADSIILHGAALTAPATQPDERAAKEREVIAAMRPFARMAHPWPGTQLIVATRDDQETGKHDIEKELVFRDALFERMWAAWDDLDALEATDGAAKEEA